MINMKFDARWLAVLFFIGVFVCPFFTLASTECFVDEKKEESGDGSKSSPYKKISKALEENCGVITVEEGTYDETINLKKGVELIGVSQGKVILTGKVTMNDDSNVEKITLDSGGIDVVKNADVDISNVKIKNAIIGINTISGGKITVSKSIITSNGKGIYVQKGGSVKIIGCKIYDNKGEGLDIRADVSGSIGENEIYNNKESGIEIILGKAELAIYNNEIKKNSSSGIAAQFYSDFDNVGKVNIKNNTISGNSSYGIDCRAPSGGSDKPKGYWSDSMKLSANKISGNKQRDFASSCKFDDEKIGDATKTKEEKEAELLALKEKERMKIISIEEKKELENLDKEKKEEEERIIKQEEEAQSDIGSIYEDVMALSKADEIIENKISSRSPFVSFFIGPNYKEIKTIKNNLYLYDEKINIAEDKKRIILDEGRLNEINGKIFSMREKREQLNNFIAAQNNKFGILSWMFKKIYLAEK